MSELGSILAELGISQYLGAFLEQGFDTWDTVVDITESDFEALGVKLGHRRKLQRRIADSRGHATDRSLSTAPPPGSQDDKTAESARAASETHVAEGVRLPAKRKYRRHPKPDENAPERPPSAYVIFSNSMRHRLKGRQLSFTGIAKLVGEHWQNLMPEEKESYEQQAAVMRDRYNNELSEYKQTENYATYTKYLADFKSRQAARQQNAPTDAGKRPKLEAIPSASSGTGSSTISLPGESSFSSRSRAVSSASGVSPWQHGNEAMSPSSSVAGQSVSTLMNEPGRSTQSSPGIMSPESSAGFRKDSHPGPQIGPSWQEHRRDEQGHRVAGMSHDRPCDPYASDVPTARQRMHADWGSDFAPPHLIRDSTTASTTSGHSYNMPRTPVEPNLDRQLPIHQAFQPKISSHHEGPISILRQSSSLTQPSPSGSQQSPHTQPSTTPSQGTATYPTAFTAYPGVHAVDFQQPMPQMRSRPSSPSRTGSQTNQGPPTPRADAGHGRDHTARMRDYMAATSPEDVNLDPVSALLKAGQIVGSRHSQPHLPLPPKPSPGSGS